MGRHKHPGMGSGRTQNLYKQNNEQLEMWTNELDRRVEAVNKFIMEEPENNNPLPNITPDTQVTIAQRTMFENFSVNEFAMRNILCPIMQQAAEDLVGFRCMPVALRIEKRDMVNPFKYGVRTLVELIDAMDKLLKRRDEYAALLPDLKEKAGVESQILNYAQEVQEGKVIAFHRSALPDTVYGGPSVYRKQQYKSSEDSVRIQEQMKGLMDKENSMEPKSVGQVLF